MHKHLLFVIAIYHHPVSPLANLTEANNITYTQGSTATLECTSLGGPENLYQWQADGANISGETSEILMLPNVTATTGGMYTCVVTNIAGSNNASTFVFIFPYFINHPDSDQVSVESAVILICDAVSFPSPDYLWQRADGGNISSDTVTNERNLSISSVEYGDEGRYFCNASVGEDSVQSQIAIVTGNCMGMHTVLLSCALDFILGIYNGVN